jgi:hypothetical protein
MRFAYVSPVTSTIIDAVRSWRLARDSGEPVQPALLARLGAPGGGFLAPVIDGLLTLFEAAFRRRFVAGEALDCGLTGDERRLLELLHHDEPTILVLRPDLASAMGIALRSTRIMLRSVLGVAPGDAVPATA